MKTAKLNETYRGWLVGDFDGALLRTRSTEVAVKREKKGDEIPAHMHEVVAEVTVVVQGVIQINDRVFHAGDLILVEPGEVARYTCIEDAITVVIKVPGFPEDKTLV